VALSGLALSGSALSGSAPSHVAPLRVWQSPQLRADGERAPAVASGHVEAALARVGGPSCFRCDAQIYSASRDAILRGASEASRARPYMGSRRAVVSIGNWG